MQPDTFRSIIQNRFLNLESMINALLRRSYETSVVEHLREYGLEEKNEIIRIYNEMTGDIQSSVKSIYSDFVKNFDEVISNAVKIAETNYKRACYSNDIFFNDNAFNNNADPNE